MEEPVHLTAEQARVIGCLVEKAMTTPDNYPLSLNGTTVACNQVSNREPVVSYDDALVERTLRELTDQGLAKMVHRPGDRVVKYRHAIDEALELAPPETALLAVLLLRGAQTPGELRQRTARYVEFASLPEVETTLEAMGRRDQPLVRRLDREPGQKEHRYAELLTGSAAEGAPASGSVPAAGDAAGATSSHEPAAQPLSAGEPNELAELKADVARLKADVARLFEELGL